VTRRRNIEELLEALWMAHEEGSATAAAELVERAHGETTASDVDEAVLAGLLRRVNGDLAFTPAGEDLAKSILRRHRLAERLLTDVLGVGETVGEEGLESSACDFEHILSPEVADAICTLLGHPTVCPHGLAIPPGPCCTKLAKETGPVVRRLTEVPSGERVHVAFIASSRDKRLERLGSFGVRPGAAIRVVQRRPSFILEVDQTTLAVECEVAGNIYVRR
jgi:DtxR family Mn-dependent transcriptional regulator